MSYRFKGLVIEICFPKKRRATVSGSSARKSPSGNPEANHLNSSLYTNFEANISPTRAAAPAFYDALATQKYYLPANQNSGGGRTEETRDRVSQQQIDRSENSNRTRARGTEIAAGTTSADRWATFPAERLGQVAAIEMRVGQNGGPLPFEAIIDFGEPIVYFLSFFFKLGFLLLSYKSDGRFLQQSQVYAGRVSQSSHFSKIRFIIPKVGR